MSQPQLTAPATSAVDVEMLLDATEQEATEQQRSATTNGNGGNGDREDRRERHDREDRRDRDRRDRRGRNSRNRESINEPSSDRPRRDDSRPRSTTKDADTTAEDGSQRRDHRHGGRRDRSPDRRGRHNDRRGGGDFYAPSGHGRSRSPRPRHGGGDRDRYRDRSRDRRRRDDDRARPAGRTATPPEPEITEDDRDKRTIFVQQISQRAETRHLHAFFEKAGKVVEAQIVKDRVTNRSKGVGYVEFRDEESVPKAIDMTGQTLKGVPIIAQHTEAEKNRASRVVPDPAAAAAANGAPFHRLYVGNIHFSVTEEDLSEIFKPFGELEQVSLAKEAENGNRSKGYGFVQFKEPAAAKAALEQMDKFDLANRPIRVGLGSDKFTPESTASLLRNFNAQAQNYQGSAFSGAGGRGAYAGGSGGVFDRTHGRDERGVTSASALEDSEVGGIGMTNMNRDRLMNLLARNPVEEPVSRNKNGADRAKNGIGAQLPRAPPVYAPVPSRCIKIQDAFSAVSELSEHGENWIQLLEDEILKECDMRYGKVVHCKVDPNNDGDIYVKFKDIKSGERALQGLNGRTFNFRRIMASYVVERIYDSLYPAASSV